MRKVFTVFVCFFIFAAEASVADVTGQSIVVVSFAGDVKVILPGKEEPLEFSPGTVLKNGTRIITGEEAHIEVAFDRSGRNLLKIKENTDVVIQPDASANIELIRGKAFMVLREINKGDIFRLRTPCAIYASRDTSGWITRTDGDITYITVTDGIGFVRGVNEDGSAMEVEFIMKGGYERRIKRLDIPGDMARISEEKLSSIKKEFDVMVESARSVEVY